MVDPSRQVNLDGDDVAMNALMYAFGSSNIPVHVFNCNGSAPSSVTTTSTTVLAAQILAGIFVNSAASAVTLTLDSATNIVNYLNTNTSGANVGDILQLELINGGNTSGAITVGAGSGGGFDTNVPAANKTVAINTAKTVFIRITNVSTPAYVIYM